MGGGDLNTKKSWHPNTMKNQEKVWKAEQQQAQENRRMEDLRKEISDEKTREELTQFGQSTGVLADKGNKKLDWMYKEPTESVDREQYLLGKAIDKTFEKIAETEKNNQTLGQTVPKNHVEHECIPFSIRNYSNNKSATDIQVDMARKLLEDPLVAIRKREVESRTQLLQNPVKLKELSMLLKAEQSKHKVKKDKKKSKKHKKDKLAAKIREKLKKLGADDLDDKINNLLSAKDASKNEKKRSKKKKKRHNSSDSDLSSAEDSDDGKNKKRKNRTTIDDLPLTKKSSKNEKMQTKKNKKRHDSSDSDSSSAEDSDEGKNKKRKNQTAKVEKGHSKDSSRYIDHQNRYGQNRSDNSRYIEKNFKHKPEKSHKRKSTSDSDSSSDDSEDYSKNKRSRKTSEIDAKKKHIKDDKHDDNRNSRNDQYTNSGNKSNYSRDDRKRRSNSSEMRGKDRIHSTSKSKSHNVSNNDSLNRPAIIYQSVDRSKKSYGLVKADGSKIDLKNKSHHDSSTSKQADKVAPKKWEPPKRTAITEEEKEAKRREMMENAIVRDRERESNIKYYKKLDKKEEKQNKCDEYREDFVEKHLRAAASQSSVESRIKSNIYNIQRSHGVMDSNFARR